MYPFVLLTAITQTKDERILTISMRMSKDFKLGYNRDDKATKQGEGQMKNRRKATNLDVTHR